MDGGEVKRLRVAHPLGVFPLGNALLDIGARPRRVEGLGRLLLLGDELLLGLLRLLPAPALARLAQASTVVRAYGEHDELWLAHCMLLLDGGRRRLRWTEACTWRSAYARMCRAVNATNGGHDRGGVAAPKDLARDRARHRSPSARVYSDTLYRGFFYAATELDPRWLERETLARVDCSCLSTEEFVSRFERQSCPVILQGCAKAWPAMHRWTRESLLERFGDVPFAAGPCDLTLSDFYAYMGHNFDDAPLFIFDRHFSRRAPGLLEDYEVPEVFRGRDLFSLLGEGPPERPDFRWLLIGQRRSGSKWHIDPNKTSAWNAVVRGRKRWLLLPPGCPPPGVHPSRDGAEVTQPVSLVEWFCTFYDELRRISDSSPAAWDLKEGTCEPGDAVFIPSGWWHCVLNLDDDTVAVTQNYAPATHLHSIRRFLHEKREQVSGGVGLLGLSLAERLDTALKQQRPDLLVGCLSEEVPEEPAPPRPPSFSFWDHLRTTGRPLTCGT